MDGVTIGFDAEGSRADTKERMWDHCYAAPTRSAFRLSKKLKFVRVLAWGERPIITAIESNSVKSHESFYHTVAIPLLKKRNRQNHGVRKTLSADNYSASKTVFCGMVLGAAECSFLRFPRSPVSACIETSFAILKSRLRSAATTEGHCLNKGASVERLKEIYSKTDGDTLINNTSRHLEVVM